MVKGLIQGLGGFDGKASSVSAVDLLGLLGTENAKSTVQALIDVIADKVLNQLLSRSNVVNNALTTEEGYALDARMGKSLQDQITAQNSNLNSLIKIAEVGVTDAIPINPSSKEVNTSISFQKSYTDPIVIATLCGGQGYVGAGCKVMSVKNNGATFKTYTTSPVGSDYSFYISYLVVVKNNQFKLA